MPEPETPSSVSSARYLHRHARKTHLTECDRGLPASSFAAAYIEPWQYTFIIEQRKTATGWCNFLANKTLQLAYFSCYVTPTHEKNENNFHFVRTFQRPRFLRYTSSQCVSASFVAAAEPVEKCMLLLFRNVRVL